MFKNLLIPFFTILIGFISAQTGRISGTILDSKTGETLPGATALIEGTTKGASADFDGKFSINNVPVGKVTLIINYISYNSKKITDIEVKASDATDINVLLDPSNSQDLQEVEVVVTLNKENNTALVLQQKNNTSISDGISAETIKRTPDKNTADVLKRISGVTIQDDKFVIVRGLNERYNASYLNGSPLPSTEPDKKAFSFDLFPSNMLDNIVVNKTATPDMPGEFAGGIIQINTKSIPEKNFVSITAGGGYNSVTTGKQKIVYKGGKYDKFGFDDGSRNIPNQVPSFEEKANWISTPDQGRVATYFTNDWAYSSSKFKPNQNFQVAAGYNIKLKERDFLGIIFSLGYNNTQSLYNITRIEYDPSPGYVNTYSATINREQVDSNTVYQQQTSTGALLNFSCKINTNNSISLKNLVTGSADNKFISDISTMPIGTPDQITRINSRFFTANQIFSSQLSGEHFIPKIKIKIMWNGGLSNVKRTVPNLRYTSYTKYTSIRPSNDPGNVPEDPNDTIYQANVSAATFGTNYSGYRVYSNLNEKLNSLKLDISRIFKITESLKFETKIGAFVQNRERSFFIRSFCVNLYKENYIAPNLALLDENNLFATQNMSVLPNGQNGFKVAEYTKYEDNYNAFSSLNAGYAMGEIKYTEKLRIIGGIRYESYSQKMKYKDRFKDSIFVTTTVNDYLPSGSIIYNINDKIGVRLGLSKTLNRAEFRELALINWYDPETRLSVAGNPALTRCYIENYDVRFEIYPGRGQLFTVSGFKKYFDKPIERYMLRGNESQIYYSNANSAICYGSELEYRINIGAVVKKDSIKFLNNLSMFSNLAIIKSIVNVKGLNSLIKEDTRPLQGQAPYIINSGISYVDNDYAFSVTAIVNRIGDRIYIVGNEINSDRWEKGRTVFDILATKSFFKNKLEIRFNVKDLFKQKGIIYYKNSNRKNNSYHKNIDYINYVRNYGSSYSLAITYKF